MSGYWLPEELWEAAGKPPPPDDAAIVHAVDLIEKVRARRVPHDGSPYIGVKTYNFSSADSSRIRWNTGVNPNPDSKKQAPWEVFLHDRIREIWEIEPRLAFMFMAMAYHHRSVSQYGKPGKFDCDTCTEEKGYDEHGYAEAPCDTVLILLSVWEHHPGYKKEWHPKDLIPRDTIHNLLRKGT